MNRRIRKKKIDAVNRILADGLRLYASRPRPANDSTAFDDLATGLLSMSIGLALRERLQQLPGTRRGFEMDPPRGLKVEMPDATTIHASGVVLIRDRRGETEVATEAFRLSAIHAKGMWRMTRVFMTPVARETWEAAV